VAHRPSHLAALEKEAALLRRVFGYEAEAVGAEELADKYHAGAEAYGGLRMTDGFAMHPMKLAWGIHRMARAAGARIHASSPVTDWKTEQGVHRLQTPQGVVRAKRVVVATNGYSNTKLIPAYNERYLPVYSQIIVTKPLLPDQLKNSLLSTDCFMDTRNLLHYYRRLPDNRIMFGGRSAIEGKDAANPKHSMVLLNSLRAKFPALSQVEFDYSWGGWVSVTRDNLPHVFQFPDVENAYGAMGYCGSGVSFSILSGRRLAELILHKGGPAVPFIRTPPPRFPFARFLRFGQRMAYHRFRWLDERG
jgi:taurine dehydrogenase large subunit